MKKEITFSFYNLNERLWAAVKDVTMYEIRQPL